MALKLRRGSGIDFSYDTGSLFLKVAKETGEEFVDGTTVPADKKRQLKTAILALAQKHDELDRQLKGFSNKAFNPHKLARITTNQCIDILDKLVTTKVAGLGFEEPTRLASDPNNDPSQFDEPTSTGDDIDINAKITRIAQELRKLMGMQVTTEAANSATEPTDMDMNLSAALRQRYVNVGPKYEVFSPPNAGRIEDGNPYYQSADGLSTGGAYAQLEAGKRNLYENAKRIPISYIVRYENVSELVTKVNFVVKSPPRLMPTGDYDQLTSRHTSTAPNRENSAVRVVQAMQNASRKSGIEAFSERTKYINEEKLPDGTNYHPKGSAEAFTALVEMKAVEKAGKRVLLTKQVVDSAYEELSKALPVLRALATRFEGQGQEGKYQGLVNHDSWGKIVKSISELRGKEGLLRQKGSITKLEEVVKSGSNSTDAGNKLLKDLNDKIESLKPGASSAPGA